MALTCVPQRQALMSKVGDMMKDFKGLLDSVNGAMSCASSKSDKVGDDSDNGDDTCDGGG